MRPCSGCTDFFRIASQWSKETVDSHVKLTHPAFPPPNDTPAETRTVALYSEQSSYPGLSYKYNLRLRRFWHAAQRSNVSRRHPVVREGTLSDDSDSPREDLHKLIRAVELEASPSEDMCAISLGESIVIAQRY